MYPEVYRKKKQILSLLPLLNYSIFLPFLHISLSLSLSLCSFPLAKYIFHIFCHHWICLSFLSKFLNRRKFSAYLTAVCKRMQFGCTFQIQNCYWGFGGYLKFEMKWKLISILTLQIYDLYICIILCNMLMIRIIK